MGNSMTYVSVLGMGAGTLQMHRQFNQEMVKMTTAATRALELQSAAAESQTMADNLASQAARDQSAAEALEAEAAAMEEEAEVERAEALAKEAQADTLSEAAAEEGREAAAHLAKAAVEDGVFKEELAAGTEMAEVALETTAEANADEAGVMLCQFIPGVDVLCDFVGGLAATSLEIMAAGEAAEATADFAASAVAKEQEEADLAAAAELEASAAAEGAEAAALHEQALVLEEEASVLEANAAAEEAEAETDLAKSAAESEAAAAEESTVAEEEAASEESFAESVRHGVTLVWLAASQVGSALFVTAYFGLRILGGYAVPTAISSVAVSENGTFWLSSLLISASSLLHAGGIFVGCAVAFGAIVEQPDQMNRGGLILGASLAAVVTQALALHIPSVLIARYNGQESGRVWVLHLILDLILLFLWNALGCFLFSTQIKTWPLSLLYILGPVLFCTLCCHHWCNHKRLSQQTQTKTRAKTCEAESESDEEIAIKETTWLLKAAPKPRDNGNKQPMRDGWIHLRHSLMFELLVATIFTALLWNCLARAPILRPFCSPAKHLLSSLMVSTAERLKWWLIVPFVSVCFLIFCWFLFHGLSSLSQLP